MWNTPNWISKISGRLNKIREESFNFKWFFRDNNWILAVQYQINKNIICNKSISTILVYNWKVKYNIGIGEFKKMSNFFVTGSTRGL